MRRFAPGDHGSCIIIEATPHDTLTATVVISVRASQREVAMGHP